MKIRQYSYFSVKSTSLSAAAMAARIEMEPDEVLVMGSRSAEHVLPRVHAWKIVCRGDQSIEDQIQHLIDRLEPVRAQLTSFCADEEVTTTMQVVRYFRDADGVEAAPPDTGWDRARQYPRPLGWHLSPSALQFLVSTRAALDVDEYDMGDDDDS